MRCIALAVSIICLAVTCGTSIASESHEGGLWLDLSKDGRTLDFLSADPADYGDETLVYEIQCAAEGSEAVGTSLMITADDANAPVARRLLDGDAAKGKPVAQFETGGGAIAAPIWGYAMDFDDGYAGWDLTLRFTPDLDLNQLAPIALYGMIHLTVEGKTYDLTPRWDDRAKLIDFAKKC